MASLSVSLLREPSDFPPGKVCEHLGLLGVTKHWPPVPSCACAGALSCALLGQWPQALHLTFLCPFPSP